MVTLVAIYIIWKIWKIRKERKDAEMWRRVDIAFENERIRKEKLKNKYTIGD